MKIKLKLKQSELTALVETMESVIEFDVAESRTEAIVYILMQELYVKLKKDTIVLQQKKYTYSIGNQTALAFIEYFQTAGIDCRTFEGNLVRQLITQFDTKTTTLYVNPRSNRNASSRRALPAIPL